jgi:hypothetical protein
LSYVTSIAAAAETSDDPAKDDKVEERALAVAVLGEGEEDVARPYCWKWMLAGGPKRVLEYHSYMKGTGKTRRSETEYFVFVCRCAACLSGNPTKARFCCMSKKDFQPISPAEGDEQLKGVTLTTQNSGEYAHRDKVYLDEQGFISYTRPFPNSKEISRQKAGIRNKLVEDNSTWERKEDMPICAWVKPGKTNQFWIDVVSGREKAGPEKKKARKN